MTNQFEVGDNTPAVATPSPAQAARASFLDEVLQSGKNPVTGDKPADNSKSSSPTDMTPSALGKALIEGAAEGINKSPKPIENSGIGGALKEALKNGIENGASPRSEMNKAGDRIKDMGDLSSLLESNKRFFGPVTDKDRAEAKEALGKGVSDLIPEGDKATLKQMQGAIIDGNVDKLKDTLGKLADDPAKMEKFIKEINGQLKREGASVELSTDSKGNVLVYDRSGNTAVSINPKSGETTLRAVERQNDGSVVLKPGEIINRKPADIMKSLGEDATRDITQPRFNKFEFPRYELHGESLQQKLKGAGGGSGGGGKDSLPSPSIIQNGMHKGLENLIPEIKRKEK